MKSPGRMRGKQVSLARVRTQLLVCSVVIIGVLGWFVFQYMGYYTARVIDQEINVTSGQIASRVSATVDFYGDTAALLAKDKERSHEDKLHELYRWVFSRNPRPEELQVAVAHIQKNMENPQVAYEDILWALINSKEFLFNH